MPWNRALIASYPTVGSILDKAQGSRARAVFQASDESDGQVGEVGDLVESQSEGQGEMKLSRGNHQDF